MMQIVNYSETTDVYPHAIQLHARTCVVRQYAQLEAICHLCMELQEQPAAHQLVVQLHEAWNNVTQFAASLGLEPHEFPLVTASDTTERVEELQKLSGQEREVFFAMLDDKSVKEIAKELNVSESTVRTYRARILQKLDLDNMLDLAKFAVRVGLS